MKSYIRERTTNENFNLNTQLIALLDYLQNEDNKMLTLLYVHYDQAKFDIAHQIFDFIEMDLANRKCTFYKDNSNIRDKCFNLNLGYPFFDVNCHHEDCRLDKDHILYTNVS